MGVFRTFATLGLLAVMCGGCGDKSAEIEQNRVRVAVGSEHDASAEVRIPALGIALAPPAEGWQLMPAGPAHGLADGARIGALGPGMIAAAVIVTPTSTTDADAYAKRLLTAMLGEAPSLQELSVHETSGRTYAVTDGLLRRAGAVWLKDGLAFELRVWGIGDGVDAASKSLIASMSFFAREGALEDVVARDQRGADWRVSGNKYENGASGLSVDTTKGLRLVVGEELLQRDPEADVIIEGTAVPMSLTVASEPVTSATARASRKEAIAKKIGGESAPAFTAEVLGQNVRLEQRKVGPDLVAFGDVCDAEICHALFARYAAKTGEARLKGALASLGSIAGERRKALLEELDGQAMHHCTASDDYALRGSTYRNFKQDFTLSAPGPGWVMHAGKVASRRVEAASVFLEARRFGLAAALVVDEEAGDDAEVHHAAVVEALSQRGAFKASGKTKKIKDNIVSQGPGLQGLSFVVATQIIGGRGLQLVLWGTKANVDAHDKDIVALIEGMSSGVRKPLETPPGGYLDRRIGLSAAMPVGWRMEVETPAVLKERGTYVTWEKDGRMVGLMAMCMPPGAVPEWSARYLEQRLRARLGPFARGALVTQSRPVAGRDASLTSWHATLENLDVVVLSRGNTVYAVAAIDHLEEALNKAIESFSFID